MVFENRYKFLNENREPFQYTDPTIKRLEDVSEKEAAIYQIIPA